MDRGRLRYRILRSAATAYVAQLLDKLLTTVEGEPVPRSAIGDRRSAEKSAAGRL
jgi:hypothetical protein